MGLVDDSGLRPHITTLSHELNQPLDRNELERTIAQAFSDDLEITFAQGRLSDDEAAREAVLAASSAVND